MATYSNSAHDSQPDAQARGRDEDSVRSMYERKPYPDLGADLKDLSLFLDQIKADIGKRESIRFLDAGCGTGHCVVSIAKEYPRWECYGIDLSQPSLDIAGKLAQSHGADVMLACGSYLDTLPFEGEFDIISAFGTIHHTADPVAAMRALRRALRDDGYMLLHLYGWRIDRRKFELKEIISIFEPELSNIERRFSIYRAVMTHQRSYWLKRLVQMPLIDIYAALRNGVRNLVRRKRNISWSPPFDARYDEPTAPWVDHFCHPCERAYEVPDIISLLRDSGFQVVKMLKQGREHLQLIPPELRHEYDELPRGAKWRLSELLAYGGGSFAMILNKDPDWPGERGTDYQDK